MTPVMTILNDYELQLIEDYKNLREFRLSSIRSSALAMRLNGEVYAAGREIRRLLEDSLSRLDGTYVMTDDGCIFQLHIDGLTLLKSDEGTTHIAARVTRNGRAVGRRILNKLFLLDDETKLHSSIWGSGLNQ